MLINYGYLGITEKSALEQNFQIENRPKDLFYNNMLVYSEISYQITLKVRLKKHICLCSAQKGIATAP